MLRPYFIDLKHSICPPIRVGVQVFSMDVTEELMNLDYVAYDHVMELEEDLDDRRIRRPDLYIGFHYEEDTPVVDVAAHGKRKSFIDSYPLEGLSIEAFDDKGYDLWFESFDSSFNSVEDIGDHLEPANN